MNDSNIATNNNQDSNNAFPCDKRQRSFNYIQEYQSLQTTP